MKRKHVIYKLAAWMCLLLAAMLLATITGCGAGQSNSTPQAYYETTAAAATTMAAAAYNYDMGEMGDVAKEAAALYGGGEGLVYSNNSGAAQGGGGDYDAAYADGEQQQVRKEIKNVNCGLIVKDVPAAYRSVAEITSDLGGYEFSKSESQRGGYIYYNLTIKLPPENLVEFESRIRATAGENAISFYNIYSEDITSAYYDVAARLDSMRASMAQYLALIGKAENVTEMLEIRREITVLQAEIDSLQGQINVWNMLVSYATITLSIEREPDPLAQTRNQQWSFNTPSQIVNSMGNGFIATGNAVYQFIIGFFVVLVSLLPVLIPTGIIVFIVLRILRKRKAKKLKVAADVSRQKDAHHQAKQTYTATAEAPASAVATDSKKQMDSGTDSAQQTETGTDGAKQTDNDTVGAKQTDSGTDNAKQTDSGTDNAKQTDSGTDGAKQTDGSTDEHWR